MISHNQYIELIDHSTMRGWVSDSGVRKIKLTTTNHTLAKALYEDGEIPHFTYNRTDNTVLPDNQSQAIEIIFCPPANKDFVVANSWDDLINFWDYSYQIPPIFAVLLDDGTFFTSLSQSPAHEKYEKVVSFAHIVGLSAHHIDPLRREFIFWSPNGRKNLGILYKLSDLADQDVASLDKLLLYFKDKDSIHFSEKSDILRKCILSNISITDGRLLFSSVLGSIKQISESFSCDFDLYLNKFSFENEIESIHKSKNEYLLKINQSLSSLQTQALALPISTVLAGIKLSDVNDLFDSILINAGVLSFSIISTILILSQIRSIRYVENEFDEKMRRIKSTSINIAHYFNNAFNDISQRVKFVRATLWILICIVWICELTVLLITCNHQTNIQCESFPKETHNISNVVHYIWNLPFWLFPN